EGAAPRTAGTMHPGPFRKPARVTRVALRAQEAGRGCAMGQAVAQRRADFSLSGACKSVARSMPLEPGRRRGLELREPRGDRAGEGFGTDMWRRAGTVAAGAPLPTPTEGTSAGASPPLRRAALAIAGAVGLAVVGYLLLAPSRPLPPTSPPAAEPPPPSVALR